ncbi:hypothetical protein SAMN05428945_6549 [Streptomyces sp. 2224.1]|nr:hypothetical protein BX261_6019 [Streptomyces sp. 2321.6]SDR00645.1 hypothetical protein SAMN05216511_1240 [Streptomyces sp. KS_16]SED84434.1 hypothetical protein SAMN05428940_6044 [Streptomyces sp. 2133.1]SEE05656.1 hypothetical protein SAMN05428945_6543 [Streptomyces sp. 2224.1]SNC72849.1 hypothetical protein SAMN06272741_5945 [Streptomyces sp. 2114.4]
MDGRPLDDGYISANITAENSISRCSARNAKTLPGRINSRQVSRTSGPIASPAQSPRMPTGLAPDHKIRSQNSQHLQ